MPENALAVRKKTSIALQKKKLKKALLEIHADPEYRDILKTFGATKFIETTETTDSNYEPVYKYAEEISFISIHGEGRGSGL